MSSPLSNLDQKLVELKTSIDELNAMLGSTTTEREGLKFHVKTDKALKEKQQNLRKQIKDAQSRLDIILEFIKESTGEDSYACFPLFGSQSQNQQAVN